MRGFCLPGIGIFDKIEANKKLRCNMNKFVGIISTVILSSITVNAFADVPRQRWGELKDEIATGLAPKQETIREEKVIVVEERVGEVGSSAYRGDVKDNQVYKMYIETPFYLTFGVGADHGMGNIDLLDDGTLPSESVHVEQGFGLVGQLAVGWNATSWLRFDLGLEHHQFNMDTTDNSTIKFNSKDLNRSATGAMINANFDLVRRYHYMGDVVERTAIVPYLTIGAGIGLMDYPSIEMPNGDWVMDGDESYVSFKLGAGISFNITDTLMLDLAYHYVNFGRQQVLTDNGTDIMYDGDSSKSLQSNDFMISIRSNF